MKLLVIEDDDVDRLILRKAFDRAGETVELVEVGNAGDALAAYQSQVFDCVLLDIVLPGTNGVELLRQLRSHDDHTPIVALTAHGDELLVVEVLKSGANEYLPKSVVEPQRLISTIHRVIEWAALKLERDKTQRALELRERQLAHFKATLNAIDDGILFIDVATTRITYANRGAALLLERSAKHLVGSEFWQLCMEASESAFRRLVTQLVDEDVVSSHEEILIDPVGETLPIEVNFQRGQGVESLTIVVATLRDIRHRLHRRREAERSRDVAIAKAQRKSEFLAQMSHEIRTPMNGIVGMATLLMGTELSPDQREYVEILARSGDALLGLVNDILDLSKIEAGKLELEAIEFDPRACVRHVIALLLKDASEKQVELRSRIDLDLPERIVGDPTRLQQAILNLVGNAVKFTPEGFVELRVRVEIGDAPSATLVIEVEDSGIGIDEAQLQSIFEPFTQAEGETTRKFGGSGLGLSICARLVRAMDGELSVRSDLGLGTTMTIRAPLRPAQLTSEAMVLEGRNLHLEGSDLALIEALALKLRALGAQVGTGRRLMTPDAVIEVAPQLFRLEAEASWPVRAGAGAPVVLAHASMEPGGRGWLKRHGYHGGVCLLHSPAELARSLRELLANVGRPEQGDVAPCDTVDPVEAQPFVGRHVLLVEDDRVNQRVARSLLEHMGLVVELVADGQAALDRLAAGPRPEIVFMDCQMPVLDGFSATERLRAVELKDGHERPLVIVAMTAHAMAGDRERCIRAGMSDYLSKPINVDELRDCVVRWLSPRGQGSASNLAPEGQLRSAS